MNRFNKVQMVTYALAYAEAVTAWADTAKVRNDEVAYGRDDYECANYTVHVIERYLNHMATNLPGDWEMETEAWENRLNELKSIVATYEKMEDTIRC